jgi:hypothetical protein
MKPGITVIEFTKPAKDYEEEMDSSFSESAPKGKFTKPVLNELVDAYREVQKLMGFEEADLYPMFEEKIVTEFPPEFVRGLAMLAKAAEDYGQPGMIDLSGVKDNAGVATLAAKVRMLAEDPEFEKFLGEDAGPEGEEDEMEDEMGAEGEMDEMFRSRS